MLKLKPLRPARGFGRGPHAGLDTFSKQHWPARHSGPAAPVRRENSFGKNALGQPINPCCAVSDSGFQLVGEGE